jgi:hypothetical protein
MTAEDEDEEGPIDIKALERVIDEDRQRQLEWERTHPDGKNTPEEDAAFYAFLREMGAIYHEEDDTVEFITRN